MFSFLQNRFFIVFLLLKYNGYKELRGKIVKIFFKDFYWIKMYFGYYKTTK